MKILQIVDERWDSGIVNYALTLAKGLQASGHDVTVAGLVDKPPLAQARALGLKQYAIKGLFPWLSLYLFVLKNKPDIINAHTGRSHAWSVLFFGVGSRIVRTRCDVRLPASNWLKHLVISRTHRIIAPSRCIQRSYEKILPKVSSKTKMISLIPQGIDTDEFIFLPEPPADAKIRIGIVGRLDPVKGHRFLIEAIAGVKSKYANIKLLVVGKEQNITIKELKAHAAALGIEHQIEFLGHLDSVSVKDVMHNCHIGVVASVSSEAVSRSVLEWMASGRAVVATNVGGIPDLISHELTGLLVEPADPMALAGAIKRFIADPAMRAMIGKYARKSIETTFSLKNFVKYHEVVYEDAIKNPAC